MSHRPPSRISETQAWRRNHLYVHGTELLKLGIYRRLCSLLPEKGGSLLKTVVYDIIRHVKNEVSHNITGELATEFRTLTFFEPNGPDPLSSSHMRYYNTSLGLLASSDVKWFHTAVGSLLMTHRHSPNFEILLDRMIEVYMDNTNLASIPDKAHDSAILDAASRYFDTVLVDMSIFSNVAEITLEINGHNTRIVLPPLPRINQHSLLVKALMHKELTRAFVMPQHPIARELGERGISLDRDTINVFRHELSFLDGFGDFFLGKEAANLIYRIKCSGSDRLCSAATNTTRTLLATNTLFLRIALAYGLPFALDDAIVREVLLTEYVTSLEISDSYGSLFEAYSPQTKYEHEMLGDYFEQYVGALLLELPESAAEWIEDLFSSVMMLYPQRVRPSYSHSAWCVDLIGRPLKPPSVQLV